MNFKALFTTALFFIIFITASCVKIEMPFAPVEEEFLSDDNGLSTRSQESGEYASIRYGVFENIDNHTVTITNIRIEGHNPAVEIPQLGTNISSASIISSSSDEPTFDLEGGEYHNIIPSGIPTNITVHFDALVSCENGLYTIPVENAEITIKASRNCWKGGNSYCYILCIDAKTLGLEEITFNPTVEDFENVTVSK